MTDIEKLILEKLDDMSLKISGLDQKVTAIDGKVGELDRKVGEIDRKVGELDRKVGEIDGKVGELDRQVGEIDGKVRELKQKVNCLDQKITEETSKIMIVIENDISKKIDIIGEGHDFLKLRLEEALQMEKKRESMELELVNLRMDNRKIKDHINIA